MMANRSVVKNLRCDGAACSLQKYRGRATGFWGRAPLLCAILCMPLPANATTRLFPGAAPCNTTLQACINGAASGDTIDLATGVYSLPQISVTKSLTLHGTGTSSVTLQPDGPHRVLATVQNLSGGVTLSKLTISGGACQSSTSESGGGIFADAGTPLTLDTVDVKNNTCATNSGGGIFVAANATLSNVNVLGNTDPGGAGGGLRATGNVTIVGGKFDGNSSFNPGGGMRVTGTLTMTGVEVSNNQNTAANTNGGGIRSDGGLTMTNCLVHDNTSANLGGGIFAAAAAITGGGIETNSAVSGGGLYATGALAITDTLFEANSASADGGGIYAAGSGVLALTGTDANNHTKFVSFLANTAGGSGGGIFSAGVVHLIGRSEFTNNLASGGDGGAIDAQSVFDDSGATLGEVFNANQGSGNGGAIDVATTVSLVGNASFTGNAAGNLGTGGAIASGGAMTIGNAAFSSNSARTGGALSPGGTLTVTSSSISGNTTSGGEGAGIFACCGFATITDVLFSGNSAQNFGGGASLQGAQIWRALFVNNGGAGAGGGLFLRSDAEIRASVFQGNHAVHGGALAANLPSTAHTFGVYDSLFLDNIGYENIDDLSLETLAATVVNNTFGRPGAAQVSVNLFSSTAQVRNNVFSGYTASIAGSGSTLTEDYNDFFNAPVTLSGAVAGTHSIAADPKFIDSANDNFRIAADSAAIDAGDNSALPFDLIIDLDGLPRRADVAQAPDSGFGISPIVDMGAYELNDIIFADGFQP